MNARHVALALLTVAVWGTNFVIIQAGLRELPPFLFVTLRFVFSALPFVFFLPRPSVPWRYMAAYGVLLGAGQFALLFYAMRADITPGLASLVIQMQAFFTIGLSMWLFAERLSRRAAAGSLLAAAGLAVIGFHLDRTVTPLGIALVLGAAMCWAVANIVVKRAARKVRGHFGLLAFIAWSSVFAVPPLLLLVIGFEGWAADWKVLTTMGAWAWSAVAWQVIGNTLFGFAAWSWLLTRYDAAVVAPYALLIPVFGMATSVLVLGEPLPPWKLVAFAMVLGGIALITLRARSSPRAS